MGALVVIPVRLHSDRLPGKLMKDIDGKPLVWHTWAAVLHWGGAAEVIVAAEIDLVQLLKSYGMTVIPTSDRHKSGTSRVCEAVQRHAWQGSMVVNVQADHPRITHATLDAVVDQLRQYPADRSVVATAAGPLDKRHVDNRNRTKVIVDAFGEARWFTRTPLAYAKHHVGVYGWHRAATRHLKELHRCEPAKAEGLEQLDWLHAGWTMPVAMMREAGDGIDDANDLRRFKAEFSRVNDAAIRDKLQALGV